MKRGAVAVLLLLATAQCVQISYPLGVEYDYNLQGTLDVRGSNNGQRSSGSFSSMNSVMALEAVQQNPTSFVFAMNLFGTQVNVGQGSLAEGILSHPEDGDDDDGGLGADMYYQQNLNGEITQVWYQQGDSPYFVEVKLGAINSFHTHILNASQHAMVLESTVDGTHYSSYSGSSGSNVAVNMAKTFSQEDFQSFADPTVKASNVKISATGLAGISNQGYFTTTAINQMVLLSDATPSTIEDNNNDVVGMTMSSFGTLSLSLNAASIRQQKNRIKQPMTLDQLKSGVNNYKTSTLKDLSADLGKIKASKRPNIQVEDTITSAIESDGTQSVKLMNKVIKFFKNADSADVSVLEKYFQDTRFTTDAAYRKKILYLATSIEAAQQFIVKYGLLSRHNRHVRSDAVFACHSIESPSDELIQTLINKVKHSMSKKSSVILGALLGRSSRSGQVLLDQLEKSVSSEARVNLLNAIGNAGPNSIPFEKFPAKFLSHDEPKIRKAALRALRKFAEKSDVLPIVVKMSRDSSFDIRREAKEIYERIPVESRFVTLQVENSDFPFNKSWGGEYKLGGSEISADFQAEIFLGTNFDCNQVYFNYEALAEANATVSLFGNSKEAFEAEAVYGKRNGQTLADEIYLKVWDDVMVDTPIPNVDCAIHQYPLGSLSKGIDDTYTLWVSVIPVVFTVSGTLDLNLAWEWQICDSKLSAEVSLLPSASFIVDGNAVVDLLIIEAGLDLSGSLNMQLIPQAYIHGTQCEVGIDVTQVNEPMSVQLESYYVWDSCKYWIFDCHWGQHNTQVWADWSMPAVNKVLENVDYKIKL